MIHVCSLARLHETVTATGASHIVTLINKTYPVSTPEGVQVDNHLWLDMDDICAPLDGYILPQAHHVEQLLSFVRAWDRTQPLVMHCHAGGAAEYAHRLARRPTARPERTHDRGDRGNVAVYAVLFGGAAVPHRSRLTARRRQNLARAYSNVTTAD